MLKKNLPVYIMNLQKTDYDNKKGITKINGKLDKPLTYLADKFKISKN